MKLPKLSALLIVVLGCGTWVGSVAAQGGAYDSRDDRRDDRDDRRDDRDDRNDRYDRDDRDRRDNDYARNDRRGRNDNCDGDVALGTGLGALGGAGVGAAVNRGNDTGAAIGGAIVGAILGNAIANDRCDDDRSDVYYYERARYDSIGSGRRGSWRNPHTGAYGDFRVLRTYQDYGYWNDNRWQTVSRRDYRRNRDRYHEVTCREYRETYRGPGNRNRQQVHVVCSDGGTWRFAGR